MTTARRVGAGVLVALALALASVTMPAIARSGRSETPAECVRALDLSDLAMRQLGDSMPTDRAAIAAWTAGHRARFWRLAHQYQGEVERFAATMTAYHEAADRCRADP